MLRKEREAHGDLTSSNIWVLETGLVKTGPPAILKLNVGERINLFSCIMIVMTSTFSMAR